jgi:hypothetical protein
MAHTERELPSYRISAQFLQTCNSGLDHGVRTVLFKGRVEFRKEMTSTRQVLWAGCNELRGVSDISGEGQGSGVEGNGMFETEVDIITSASGIPP